MSDEVQFDTDTQGMQSRPGMPPRATFRQSQEPGDVPGMAGWLIRHGVASSASGAQRILIGIIVIDIAAMFIIIKYLL